MAYSLDPGTWLERQKYEQAEAKAEEYTASSHSGLKVEGKAISIDVSSGGSEIRDFINETKSRIEQSLKKVPQSESAKPGNQNLEARVAKLEAENKALAERVAKLEKAIGVAPEPEKEEVKTTKEAKDDDDDDFDLFGSDDEEEIAAAEKRKAEALAAYKAKKEKKPQIIAKSSIILEVKPWDDETDMKELEQCVRSIEADGLQWKASKLVPVAYGVLKLQINCVVEDDKIGTDFLEEEITKFEDFVQSVDIAAFNKL